MGREDDACIYEYVVTSVPRVLLTAVESEVTKAGDVQFKCFQFVIIVKAM